MKKYFLYMFLILGLFMLTGCDQDKDNVKMKSKNQILSYAKREFLGEAEYIDTKSEEYATTYSLKDKETSIKYECTSSVEKYCDDCMWYAEFTTCDFEEKYKEYVTEKLNLKNVYKTSSYYDTFISLKYKDEEKAKTELEKVKANLSKIDKRGFFNEHSIEVYDNNNNRLGTYEISTGEYTSYGTVN